MCVCGQCLDPFVLPIGPSGAAGTNGSQGLNGNTGATGAAGLDGSIWYAGAGIPGAGIGVDGDYFLNTLTGDVYGPKTGGAWGAITMNLVGASGTNGTNGTDGNSFYTGTGTPSGALGISGDSYVDLASAELFIWQRTAFWTNTTIGLKGADGADGADGVDGSVGSFIASNESVVTAAITTSSADVITFVPDVTNNWDNLKITFSGSFGTPGTGGTFAVYLDIQVNGVIQNSISVNVTDADGDKVMVLMSNGVSYLAGEVVKVTAVTTSNTVDVGGNSILIVEGSNN
tara:strand:- start:7148 stop:8008 length:861 start_codon:yes stop_codon:yes gene_type:complete